MESFRLPEKVKADIKRLWMWEKRDIEHIAKQVACAYLEQDKTFGRDQNHVVDICLEVGILAEQMRNSTAQAFIGAAEARLSGTARQTT